MYGSVPKFESIGYGYLRGQGNVTEGAADRAQLCDTEVQQLYPCLRQHDVRRLEVAMHDALGVSGGQGVRHVDSELQCLVQRQRAV